MEEKKRFPVIVLSVLGMIILVLVIIIVIVLKPWEDPKVRDVITNKDNTSIEAAEQRIDRRREAIQDCENIKNQYELGETNFSDIEKEFNNKMLSSDPIYNLYFAICYAGFVYNDDGSVEETVQILEKVEPQLENVNDDIASDYYVALRSIYKNAGDDEMVDYYNSKVEKLLNNGNAGEKNGSEE